MIPRSWAKWGQEPGGERTIWFWWPPAVPIEADQDMLRANQWIPLESEQQTLLLALKGQLADLAYVLPPSSEVFNIWIQQKDLQHAEQVPVVLAFYLPEQDTSAEVPSSQPVTAPTRSIEQASLFSTRLPVTELFPPIGLGEIALVADKDVGGWRSYTMGVLDAEGRALLQQLHIRLQQVAAAYQDEPFEIIADPPSDLEVRPLQSFEQHRRFYQKHVQDLHRLAQQLANHYWAAHQQLVPPAPTRALPEAPHVIHTGAVIPAPQPVQAVLAAYSNAQSGAEEWVSMKDIPTFVYSKEEGTTSVEFRPGDPDVVLDDITIQSLWHQVRQLSDIDGDVLLAMLAQAIATQHEEKDGAWITSKLILDYRGITPIMKRENGRLRRAGHRQEDLADVAACVSRMSNTWIRVEQWIEEDINAKPVPRRTRKKQRPYLYTRESRLINVTDIIRQHELHQEPQPAQSRQSNLSVAWRYQIGSWVDPFLQGANRQVAWLLQQALSYDPYHEMWEKRLARYFTFHMRINATKGGVTITREIGVLIEELSLSINQRDPERTRQRFEKAMRRLETDQLISGWSYSKDNIPLPPRKWLEPWLKHNIWVTVAPVISGELLPGMQQHQETED